MTASATATVARLARTPHGPASSTTISGSDEFIDFCREVGTEPVIAVNTGFGDAYSAAQEVEYCNGSADTVGGSWRAKNGHAKPYGVKYWCVGNEMWGPGNWASCN